MVPDLVRDHICLYNRVMTKQALDIEADDVVIIAGEHQLVHGVCIHSDGVTLTFHEVTHLESVQVSLYENIIVVGKW